MTDFEGIVLDDIAGRNVTSAVLIKMFYSGIKIVGSKNGINSQGNSVAEKSDLNVFVRAWKHYEKQSKSVEVFYKNDDEGKKVLAKVHFRCYQTVSMNYMYYHQLFVSLE